MSPHVSAMSVRVPARGGVALVSVLYFLVVCALTIAAVLFAGRSATRSTFASAGGAQLLAAAEDAINRALGSWSAVERARQPVGGTSNVPTAPPAGIATSVMITRITTSIYSLVGEARFGSDGAARRVSTLVRLPTISSRARGALVSAVDVTVGPEVRFRDDSSCSDPMAAAIILAPTAALSLDAGISPGMQPSIERDSVAVDSTTYLRVGDVWWSELAAHADVRLAGNVSIVPSPQVSNGRCIDGNANWGDPRASTSACAARAPIVYVAGDLTIEGGAGQGVLLVDGHLAITGAFTYSGQIVARHGIETRADNIAISGVVYAWRASVDTTASRALTNEVMLTHATTLRHSVCDAQYGVASWQQPRRVRERAWAELF